MRNDSTGVWSQCPKFTWIVRLAEYTGAVLQVLCSGISLHALQNVQRGDEQGFWCYLNFLHTQQQLTDTLFCLPLYTQRSNTYFPFPEYVEKQFLCLKTATFMEVFPTASEFWWNLQGCAVDLILSTLNLLQPKVF